MSEVYCEACGWEGDKDELIADVCTDEESSDDTEPYYTCPECGSDEIDEI